MVCPDPRRRVRRALWGCLVVVSLAAGSASADGIDPLRLAGQISELGPRTDGSEAKNEAVLILRAAMESAGLVDAGLVSVEGRPDLLQLEGVLPGESGLEVVLTAHLDTVDGSPGAADDAAGCAVVLATAARLAELPRRHSLRVVLFDGEERGHSGARAWADTLGVEGRRRILAAVNVDLVGWKSGLPGVILPLVGEQDGLPRAAPGWLVGAALAAGRSVERPLGVASSTAGLVGQVLARSVDLVYESDAEALLATGLPAMTLSDVDLFRRDPENHGPGDSSERLDAEGLQGWVERLGALVLRLDTLSGRPVDDDQYLAAFGRVWSRRTLYWVGIIVWALLVLRGLPGTWRGRGSEDRRRAGRGYLPGFAARFVFLGCLLMMPVFTTVLLLPAATLLALPERFWPVFRWRLIVAMTPLLLVLVGLVIMVARGAAERLALGLPAGALLLLGLGSLVWLLAEEGDSPS